MRCLDSAWDRAKRSATFDFMKFNHRADPLRYTIQYIYNLLTARLKQLNVPPAWSICSKEYQAPFLEYSGISLKWIYIEMY